VERIDNIQKLLAESAGDSYTVKRKKAKALARKWERVGLLEGLDRENDILNMSLLLENQAKQLLKESTATGTTVNAEEWSGVALPLVRRVFGQITAKDFVSVQPMNLPSGLVFYINYKYGTDKPGWSAATIGTDKVHGVTSGTGAPYGGFYGQGRFGYATNNYTASVACTTGSVSMYDIEFNEDYSSSLADSHAVKLTIPTSSA